MRFFSLSSKEEKQIFFSALAVKCLFIVLVLSTIGFTAPLSSVQSDGYLPLAQSIFERGAYSYSTEEPYVPEALHVPGYPVFLAIFAVPFDSINLVFVIQALLLSLSAVFLYRLLEGLLPQRARFWGVVVYAVEPFTSFLAAQALTEALFMFLFVGGLLLVRRAYESQSAYLWLASGLIFGTSLLVRPIIMYLIPVAVVVLACVAVFKRSKTLAAAVCLFVLSCALLPGMWVARNYVEFGVATLSTKGPYTLYFYNVEQLLEYRDGIGSRDAAQQLFAMAKVDHPELRDREDLRNPIYAEYLNKKSFEIIAQTPLLYVKMHLFSIVTFFLSDGYRLLAQEIWHNQKDLPNITKAIVTGNISLIVDYFRSNPLSAFLFFFGSAFWGLSALFAAISLRGVMSGGELRATRLAILGALCYVIYFALLTGPVAQARYRIVITPFLFPLAAYTLFVWAIPLLGKMRTRYAR